MALIKFGSVVTDGSGKLGGHCIQNSKGGRQLRNNPIPTGNPSPAQLEVRRINGILQQGWRDLTENQRKEWNLWPGPHKIMTVRNPPEIISGHDLWMKYNFSWIAAGGGFLPDPSYWGGPIYGPEIITNGKFNGSAPWSFKQGWQYQPFKAVYLDTIGNNLSQVAAFVTDKATLIEFDIFDCPGVARLFFANQLSQAIFTAPYQAYFDFVNGHYSINTTTIKAGTSFLIWATSAGDRFSIDNISLKQIF